MENSQGGMENHLVGEENCQGGVENLHGGAKNLHDSAHHGVENLHGAAKTPQGRNGESPRWVGVTTMSNSRSYLVTPVVSQHCSSTLVALTCSGHSRAVRPLLSTTLGLYSIHSLPHLAVYPVCS